MIQLEQLFWGHDGGRYRLLGASSQTHIDDVGRIRDKLGTPDGLSEVKPFLVSVPSGDLLIMMCGQRGKPDNIGRKTLFFHTLIGNRAECTWHRVNAYSLWKAGYFKSECPASVEAVSVPELPEILDSGVEPPLWNGEKLAIRSGAPENELLCRLLGSRINDVAWAGFTWNPLNDFQLYAISRFADPPSDRPWRDGDKETVPLRKPSGAAMPVPAGSEDGKIKIVAMTLGILLLISLGFNIWFARRPVSEPSRSAPKKEIHSVSVPQPRVEIQKDAPARKPKIDFNWDEELTKAPDIYTIWIHKGKGHKPEDYQFLVKVKEIIEGSAK